MSARCSGAAIFLQTVTPNNGWSAERGSGGPHELEVTFQSRGENEQEIQVKGACVRGVPRFGVESSGGGESDDERPSS